MSPIVLPWPPRELSPNFRGDRRASTPKRAKYRQDGFLAAHEATARIPSDACLIVTFHPPCNRKRDLDNLLAQIKVGLDGIAAACGVDDSGWSFAIHKGEVVKHGRVVIAVLPAGGVGGFVSIGDVAKRLVQQMEEA